LTRAQQPGEYRQILKIHLPISGHHHLRWAELRGSSQQKPATLAMTISKAAVQTMDTVLKLNLIFVQIEVNVTKFLVELRFFLKFNLFLLPILLAGFGADKLRRVAADFDRR
jgi:hypothetical protein